MDPHEHDPTAVNLQSGEYEPVAISDPGGHHSPWVVLVSTSLAVFAVFLDTTVGFVTFPAISETFASAGSDTVAWVLTAYTLVFASTLIPFGRLADRVGRRRMFLIGVIVFTVGSMLCGLAPTIWLLIGAEMVEAVGAAILVPSSLALVLQTFPRHKIPQAVAIWGAISAVAGSIGPTVGALLVTHLSWRWAFFINVPVGIVSFLLGRAVLPEGREARPGRLPDAISILVLGTGIAVLTYSIVETRSTGWTSVRFAAGVLVAAVLVVVFWRRSASVPNPVVHLSLFRINNFRWATIGQFAFSIGFSAMFLGNVLFLTTVWHYSILRAGLGVSIGPLIVAVLSPRLGKLAGRIGQRRLIIPGGLVWGCGGVYLLARVTTQPDYVRDYLPALVCTALGVALCFPQLSSSAVQGVPADQFGVGSAVGQAVRNIGSTVGVALVIAFTAGLAAPDALDGFHQVWALLIVAGLAVSLTASRLATPAQRTSSVSTTGAQPATATDVSG